jgi:hypothetical protein
MYVMYTTSTWYSSSINIIVFVKNHSLQVYHEE